MERLGGRLKGVAFFGGGSGGHLYPGLAVAERARERFPEFRALFFRTARKVDERIFSGVPPSRNGPGIYTRTLELETPTSPRAWFRYSFQAVSAMREISVQLKEGFDAVVGLGGYASLPGVLAARQEGLPVVLLEQNQIPGRVNRLLAPFVSAVSCPNPEVASRLRGRGVVTGNPVRRSVLEAAMLRQRRSSFYGRKRRVLVFGGSQGAQGLNEALRGALNDLAGFRDTVFWNHVTGEDDQPVMEEYYRQAGWDARVWSYCPGLPHLMADSDLVIARAGGTTVAELAVLGVPALLVPYPHHSDEHQLKNARVLEREGGAVLVAQKDFGADAIRRVFEEVLFFPRKLRQMEAACHRLARPDAADAVLNLLLELRKPCRQDSVYSS